MKIKKDIYVFLILVIYTPMHLSAQQEANYTQYMYNTSIFNPAYVGSRGTFHALVMHRSQWVGIDGAPTTQALTVHSVLGEKQGWGGQLFRETIGPSTKTVLSADFAHRIALNDSGTILSFGVKGGIQLFHIDFNKLQLSDQQDGVFQTNVSNRIFPIAGVGIFAYDEKWYFGVSIPNVLKTRFFENTSITKISENLHYYVIGGYVFQVAPNVQLKPTGIVRISERVPVSIDLSANMIFNKKITVGVSYGFGTNISVLGAFQFSEKTTFGYSYSNDTSILRNINLGTHEFFLRYELPVETKKTKYLRCF